MNVKFLKGLFENYKAITSKDANTLYFITDNGALYLGDKLIGKDYDASILALQNLIGEVPEGYASLRAYVDSIVTGSGYVTVGVMEAAIKAEADRAKGIEEGLRTDVDAIKGDYLKAEDKTALQDEIDADVKVVSDAFDAYKTSNDAEVLAVRGIAEAARTEEEVNGQIDAKITALNLGATYEPIGAETRAKAYVDGKFTDANLDQYTTEQEVKDIVDGVIAGAADSETYNSLTKLVDYIDAHGGEAADMAEAIETLEGKVATIEGKPAYDITDANIETWNGKTTMAEVEDKGYAVAADLGALAKKNVIGASDITDGVIGKVKLDANVQASLDKADSALQAHQDISGKADKVSGAVAGNFAGLDSNGNLVDSGKKAADFATAAQGEKADSAVQSVSLASGTNNGTVKLTVDGTETDNIAVTGLGSAAYVATTAFDAAGAADAAAAGALEDAKEYVDGIVGVAASVEGGPSGLYAAIQGSTNNTVKDCVDEINAIENQLTWGSF